MRRPGSLPVTNMSTILSPPSVLAAVVSAICGNFSAVCRITPAVSRRLASVDLAKSPLVGHLEMGKVGEVARNSYERIESQK
jgi:hypothetical protein